MDHYIKERLHCRYYIRYMDDFVVFHDDKDFLWRIKASIVEYLGSLKLMLHENKCRVFKAEKGVPFLGLIIFPHRRRLKRGNIIRFKRRLKRFQRSYMDGLVSWPHILQSIRSWLGHAQHADTVRLRDKLLADVVFKMQGG